MARYVVTVPVTVVGSGYTQPPRTVHQREVLELTPAEVTAIGAGNLRAVAAANTHETSGEAFAVSNGF